MSLQRPWLCNVYFPIIWNRTGLKGRWCRVFGLDLDVWWYSMSARRVVSSGSVLEAASSKICDVINTSPRKPTQNYFISQGYLNLLQLLKSSSQSPHGQGPLHELPLTISIFSRVQFLPCGAGSTMFKNRRKPVLKYSSGNCQHSSFISRLPSVFTATKKKMKVSHSNEAKVFSATSKN